MKNSKITFPPKTCTGCGVCSASCPRKCIQMKQNAEGFLFPEIQANLCIKCDICKNICPLYSADHSLEFTFPSLFAAYHKDIMHRRQSTSGGAFAAIAEEVIARGGVVFGSAFNDTACTSVICRTATTEEELSALKKSKYIQSDSSHVYAEIDKILHQGRIVLFPGPHAKWLAFAHFLRRILYKSSFIPVI